MAKKYKHKVMVEVTFETQITAKHANFIIREVLGCADKIVGAMGWADAYGAYIKNIVTKEGERVLAAARRNDQ